MKKILAVLLTLMLVCSCFCAGFAEDVQPFLGAWMADTLVTEGQELKAADFFMVMRLVLNEDGTATFAEDSFSDPEPGSWYMENGTAYVGTEEQWFPLTFREDGYLVLDMEGDQVLFVPDDGSAPAQMPGEDWDWSDEDWDWLNEDATEGNGELPESMLGTWVEIDGYGSLDLYSDGTAMMTNYDDTVVWYRWEASGNHGKFLDGNLEGDYIELKDDVLEVSGGWMVYTRDGKAPMVPVDQVPALDREAGAPYAGLWQCDTVTMDGETVKAADYFITTTIELCEDGSAIFTEDEYSDPEMLAWYVEENRIYMGNNEELLALEVDAEGHLVLCEEEVIFTFVHVEEPADDPFAGMSDEELFMALMALMESTGGENLSALPEHLQGYVGTWYMCYTQTGGLSGDLRTMGVNATLTLNADGSGSLDFPAEENGTWYEEDGLVYYGEGRMPLTLREGGFLQYGTEMGGYMMFSQDPDAVWVEPQQAPAAAPVPAEGFASAGFATLEDRLEKKFVCTAFTSSGMKMTDVSMLGGEYAVTFHADGSCDFVMAGMPLPGTTWVYEQVPSGLSAKEAFVIDYYTVKYNAVLTDYGFDLDNFGTVLHMELAK